MSSPVVTALAAYAGTYAQELIGQMFEGLDTRGLKVIENIKSNYSMTKLSVGNGLTPYTPTFAPSDDLAYSERVLVPGLAKRELEIEVAKYHNTWMGETMKKNSKYYDIPFESYVMMKVVEAMQKEVNRQLTYNGDTASVTPAQATCDGFKKLILALIAGGQAAVATGAVTSANAVAKFEQMATALPEEWKGEDLNLLCSYAQYDNYILNYRTTFGFDPAIYSDVKKDLYLKVSQGMIKIQPVHWLAGSSRLILTHPDNLVLGTDLLDDMHVINAVPTVWTVQLGIRFLIGYQIADAGAIWYNDQA